MSQSIIVLVGKLLNYFLLCDWRAPIYAENYFCEIPGLS